MAPAICIPDEPKPSVGVRNDEPGEDDTPASAVRRLDWAVHKDEFNAVSDEKLSCNAAAAVVEGADVLELAVDGLEPPSSGGGAVDDDDVFAGFGPVVVVVT